MITKEKLIEQGFKEERENGLSFYTRDGFTIVCINGQWCPCYKELRERLIGEVYITEMHELEKLICESIK